MAKNDVFDYTSSKTQKQLDNFIRNNLKKISKSLTNTMVDAFIRRAKKNLVSKSTPLDSNSANLVKNVANNIVKVKKRKYTYVKIKPDSEGLYMFLEYGTGLVGKEKPHPEASKIGWGYMTRPEHYISAHTTIDRSGGLKTGFVFKNDKTNYLDKEDTYIIRQSGIKKYQLKKTGEIKVYGPYRYFVDNYILSSGLKPVRYIYDTKMAMKRLIKENKGKCIKEIRKALKNF